MTRGGRAAARKYARALVDITEAKGETKALDEDLQALSSLLARNQELGRALASPAVPNDKKKAILARILGKGSKLLSGLAQILFDHDQFNLLPLIADAFHEAWNVRRGVTAAEAVSAAPLAAAQQKALEKALEKTQGGPIELKTATDPTLLGGLLVRMGGRTYDGTVRAHLRALRQALAGES